MPFNYTRTIRFQDTDAAGVVYFANVLSICHEAYEESLAISGIDLKLFFSNSSKVALPVVQANINFFHPIFCGDQIFIQLTNKYLDSSKFEIIYQVVTITEQPIAKATTIHLCINSISRTRTELPDNIILWLRQWGG